MSSCFFSSRLKMRISAIFELRNCFKTALPNEPVPPVIRRHLDANIEKRQVEGVLNQGFSAGTDKPVLQKKAKSQLGARQENESADAIYVLINCPQLDRGDWLNKALELMYCELLPYRCVGVAKAVTTRTDLGVIHGL